jgi:hypothetical protein
MNGVSEANGVSKANAASEPNVVKQKVSETGIKQFCLPVYGWEGVCLSISPLEKVE